MTHRPVLSPRTLTNDLLFPECPRWHEGRLWFSDQYRNRVFTLSADGALETMLEVPNHPSGLGWDSRGRLLVVSMHDRKLLRFEGGALRELADLSQYAEFHCNDMVVDRKGRAYVGNFGFDLWSGSNPNPTRIALVDEDGNVRVAAQNLMFPNGMVITPDAGTLIVSETFGGRLTAFDIAADGSLSNRREWAQVGKPTDGICLDAEGCIWVAVPELPGAFLRVAEGGEVKQRIDVADYGCYACMLGGPSGRTLFMLEARQLQPALMQAGNGRIRCVEVQVGHAGLP